jgi:hypothetical protein
MHSASVQVAASGRCQHLDVPIRRETTGFDLTLPYVLHIGSRLSLVSDGCPVIVRPSIRFVKFDVLMKSFYVFNVHFPKQVLIFCNFLHNVFRNLDPSKLTESIGNGERVRKVVTVVISVRSLS